MGGLRSRILRTLQSFPNAAAAQSNLLLPPAPNAGASPQPLSAEPSGCIQQEPALPQEPAIADGAGAATTVSDGKENISPGVAPRKAKKMKLSSEHDRSAGPGEVAGYRRPDFASATLFDPDLLAEFRRAVDAYAQALEASKRHDDDVDGGEEDGAGVAADPLEPFERRCPPGGERAVVLYTTSLRGVRKTSEDCARVRRLLECLRVAFLERDVSMHAAYRDELRALLLRTDDGAAAFPVPPRLFVDGRYIGGADEVVALHERSQLRPVLRRAPHRGKGEGPCAVCGGAWFMVCGGCSGSHWLHDSNAGGTPSGRVPCTACNENGLVPCPLCS
jgi:glutaredoxin domain-containing cysteine-rich protein 1